MKTPQLPSQIEHNGALQNVALPPSAPTIERFLVILADDCLPESISVNGRETECLFLSTANVLASDRDEAMVLASEAIRDGHHRPVTALTVADLSTLASALERCSFTGSRRITYTIGGYATAEQLERVAAADIGETSILEA